MACTLGTERVTIPRLVERAAGTVVGHRQGINHCSFGGELESRCRKGKRRGKRRKNMEQGADQPGKLVRGGKIWVKPKQDNG